MASPHVLEPYSYQEPYRVPYGSRASQAEALGSSFIKDISQTRADPPPPACGYEPVP